MAKEHSPGGLLHRATHRTPGVPAHAERPAGHQGRRSTATRVTSAAPWLTPR
ncbi:hypothetical protein ACFQY4_13960 [Catellatospora bangladeshensis]|uniref:hypothetical protein n=1 Tax=Catellatospora bangladeshensis TaxID=310355 RepID=UPI00361AC312